MTHPELVPPGLQLAIGSLLGVFLLWVVGLIQRGRLALRESLLWLLSTFVALLFVIFPQALRWASDQAGVKVASNGVFALGFAYVIVNLLSVTLAVARNAAHARRLSQECALLRGELTQINRRIQALADGSDVK
jgi:hypothetical protein